MKELIFGSTAIKHHFPSFERKPKDLDVISKDTSKTSREKEYFWNDAFQYIFDNNIDEVYVDKDFLYTIKVSHLAWDINFDKHMIDSIFLRNNACKLDLELYNLLILDWRKIHGEKQVKMNVPNSDFFKETITRKYNHEWLHEQFMFYKRPLNERIRKDLDSPLCSLRLWNSLSYDDKLLCALEELFVLTSERCIFVDKPLPYKFAIIKTLKMMITSTTSGWFNLFLIENFDKLIILEHNHFKEIVSKIKAKNSYNSYK